jgi:hypothetical protein
MRFLGTYLLAAGALTSLALGVAAQTPPPQITPRPPALPSELVAKLARLRDAALSSDYAWRGLAVELEHPRPLHRRTFFGDGLPSPRSRSPSSPSSS